MTDEIPSVKNGGLGQPKGAESSKMAAEGRRATPDVNHALGLADFMYNVGYLGQNWTDVHLSFFGTGIELHRIMLARSPYLLRLIMDTAPGSSIHLTFDDESITEEAVQISLQHLYRPSQYLVTPANARAVLATAILFGSIPELVHHSYAVMRDSISVENAVELAQWAVARSTSPAFSNGTLEPTASDRSGEGQYGIWSSQLTADVNYFLINTLPNQISESELVSVYAQLPFDLVKQCIESDDFTMESIQQRFSFAKKVVANRRKAVAATGKEEAAVLAMLGNGMAVIVTRKPKKSRNYYKVEA